MFSLLKWPSLVNTKIENIVGILLKNEKLLLMYFEKKLIFCQSIRLPSHMLPPRPNFVIRGSPPFTGTGIFFFKKIINTEMQKTNVWSGQVKKDEIKKERRRASTLMVGS
jgi:hypothetical protein